MHSSALILLLVLVPGQVDPGGAKKTVKTEIQVPTTVRTDYYEVRGTSAKALLDSLEEYRPFDYHAYTYWYIDWNYEFLIKPDSCVLRSFDVRVQVRHTFAKWVDQNRASRSLNNQWKNYMAAVSVHENGHTKIGVAAARRMLTHMNSKLWQAKTRKELKALIDNECEVILKKFKTQEIAYDEKTDHGATQKARLMLHAGQPRK